MFYGCIDWSVSAPLQQRGYIKAPRPEERAASFTAAGLPTRSSSEHQMIKVRSRSNFLSSGKLSTPC